MNEWIIFCKAIAKCLLRTGWHHSEPHGKGLQVGERSGPAVLRTARMRLLVLVVMGFGWLIFMLLFPNAVKAVFAVVAIAMVAIISSAVLYPSC